MTDLLVTSLPVAVTRLDSFMLEAEGSQGSLIASAVRRRRPLRSLSVRRKDWICLHRMILRLDHRLVLLRAKILNHTPYLGL